MKWNAFRRFQDDYALTREKNDPYFWLYYGMILHAIDCINIKEANPTPIDFIFDNQNKIGERAKGYYQIFKGMCTPRVLAMLGNEPEFGDEKVLHQLQAADMFAWFRRRDCLNSLYGEWYQRIWSVLDRFHWGAIIEEDHLAYMATIFGVMKRP